MTRRMWCRTFFVAAYQVQFDGDNLSAWLFRITYNKSIDYVRRRKTTSLYDLQDSMLITEQGTSTEYSPDSYMRAQAAN